MAHNLLTVAAYDLSGEMANFTTIWTSRKQTILNMINLKNCQQILIKSPMRWFLSEFKIWTIYNKVLIRKLIKYV